MASFFNLTLDTTPPSGLSISLNDGAIYTTSTSVQLKTTLDDSDKTAYQMLVWGIDGVENEADASWGTFLETKSITVPTGDGLKVIHVKVRDDVGNVSAEATAQITLDTSVPVVTVTGPDKSRISKNPNFNVISISFTSDVDYVEYKVCVVPATNSIESAGTVIPTTAGSTNTSGTADNYVGSDVVNVKINGADLETASSGDGVKIIKVFVKNAAGTWSVA